VKTEPLRVHCAIAHLMDRHVHCGSSMLSAVRQTLTYAYPEEPAGYARVAGLSRQHRRYFIAGTLLHHARSQSLYRGVTSGCLGGGEVPNPYRFNPVTKQITINRKKTA